VSGSTTNRSAAASGSVIPNERISATRWPNWIRVSGQQRLVEARSDAQIIAASESEPHVFATIFDRHYDAVHRYLARRVGVDVTDDLAAEAFTEAFDVRARFDIARPDARPWLFGIATNLLRHHHRSEARRLRAYARVDRPPDTDEADGVIDARLDAHRAGPMIATALAQLTPDERDVLLLFAWADLRYEEIAVALQIPIGTVRSRLSRARGRLRELIGRSGQYQGADHLTEALDTDG
jgi:RNA polymerase sigma factor (sigma-70 family)